MMPPNSAGSHSQQKQALGRAGTPVYCSVIGEPSTIQHVNPHAFLPLWGLAMWTTFFSVAFVISLSLLFAAIALNPA